MTIPSAAACRTALYLLALLLTNCSGDGTAPQAAVRRPLYFDVKGLVEQQIKLLSQRRPAVTKQVSLREQAPETVRVPTVKWADELQIFFQADINKAALRGAYAVDSLTMPGGLLLRRYTRRPGQANAPVAQLTVLSEGPNAREVAATINQHNTLFSTRKQLLLQLSQGQLRHYEVLGTQKLLLFDTLRYSTSSQVE
jgi:hypothetical protein